MKRHNISKRILAMVLAIASLTLTACGNVNSATPAEATVGSYNQEDYYEKVKASDRTWLAYDFGTYRNYGDTCTRGDNIDFEGYQGIRLDTSNGQIKYAVYNHSALSSNKNIKVDLYKCGKPDTLMKTLATMNIPDGEIDSEWKTISDKLEDGLYRINSSFLYLDDNSYDNISGYVIVRNGKAETCRLTNNTMATYSSQFAKLVAENGKDPSKFLSNKDITYPTDGRDGACNHVKEWENQADEIIKEKHLENATDEAKVFFFEEWLAKNIAYDMWRVRKNNNESRAHYYSNWSDDNLFSYYNHVGQCWDFVNMMAIMCRHVGIPCTDVSDAGHTITCVYMNDEWVCMDITLFTRYTNWEEVPDPDKYKKGEWRDGYPMHDYYGYFPNDKDEWEACIWTSKNNGIK